MTAPSMVASAEVADWQSSTSPRSVSSSVSWQTGDIIIVHGGAADADNRTLNTPTVTGLTFSLVDSEVVSGDNCSSYLWSATAGSNGSGTIQGSATAGTVPWGIAVEVWRGSDGLGNTASTTSTTKTVSLTRAGANSVVSYGGFDWSASSAAATWTPTGQTVIESSGDDTNYGIHVAHWGDQGAAGTTSYGISSSSSGSFAKVAVEIKGSGGVTGVATGAFVFNGQAVGQARTLGVATGAFVFSGTAQGTTQGQVQGQGTGAFVFNGQAVGQKQIAGTVLGSYVFSGTASGTPRVFGTALGAYVFTGAAIGITGVIVGPESGPKSLAGIPFGHALDGVGSHTLTSAMRS